MVSGVVSPRATDRVLVIGAGLSGLIYAAVLRQRGLCPTIVESRSEVGGLWLDAELSPTDLERDKKQRGNGGPSRCTCNAVYEELHTNLPHATMITPLDRAAVKSWSRRSGNGSPADRTRVTAAGRQVFQAHAAGAFVTAREMQRHVCALADLHGLRPLIEFDTMVAALDNDGDSAGWIATCLSRTLRRETVRRFAFVVVANGHYGVPFVPPSLSPAPANGDSHAGRVIHSSAFTHPRAFDGKRVLVVGAGPSGRDIVAGILRWRTTNAGLVGPDGVLGRPAAASSAPLPSPESSAASVGWSVRLPSERGARDDAGCIEAYRQSDADLLAGRPAWLRLHPQPTRVEQLSEDTVRVGRTLGAAGCLCVSFADARVAHYDVVICATGFRYSFPFLDGLTAPETADTDTPTGTQSGVNGATGVSLVAGGHGVSGLHLNLFPAKDPTIAFATLSYGIAPFQLARAQAEFCGAMWSEWRAMPTQNAAEFSAAWASRVAATGKVNDGRVGLGGLMWRLVERLLRAAGRPVGSRVPELLYLVTGALRRRLPLGEYQRVLVANLRIVDGGAAVAADAVWPGERHGLPHHWTGRQKSQSSVIASVRVSLPASLAQWKARL